MILQRTTCTWVCESHKLTEPSGLGPGAASAPCQDSGSILQETCVNLCRLFCFLPSLKACKCSWDGKAPCSRVRQPCVSAAVHTSLPWGHWKHLAAALSQLIPAPEAGGKRKMQDGFLVLLLWMVEVTPKSLQSCLGGFPVTPAEPQDHLREQHSHLWWGSHA